MICANVQWILFGANIADKAQGAIIHVRCRFSKCNTCPQPVQYIQEQKLLSGLVTKVLFVTGIHKGKKHSEKNNIF